MKIACKIGVDLDSTMADLANPIVEAIKDEYGLDPKRAVEKEVADAFLKWCYGDHIEKILPDFEQRIYVNRHLYRDLPKLEPDVEQLPKNLLTSNNKVYVITARTPKPIITDDTLFWLKKNNFTYTDVIFQHKKAKLCKAMGVVVMYDDDPKQIIELVDAGINVVVRDMPWNRDLDKNYEKAIKRASNWKDALREIRSFIYRS